MLTGIQKESQQQQKQDCTTPAWPAHTIQYELGLNYIPLYILGSVFIFPVFILQNILSFMLGELDVISESISEQQQNHWKIDILYWKVDRQEAEK